MMIVPEYTFWCRGLGSTARSAGRSHRLRTASRPRINTSKHKRHKFSRFQIRTQGQKQIGWQIDLKYLYLLQSCREKIRQTNKKVNEMKYAYDKLYFFKVCLVFYYIQRQSLIFYMNLNVYKLYFIIPQFQSQIYNNFLRGFLKSMKQNSFFGYLLLVLF